MVRLVLFIIGALAPALGSVYRPRTIVQDVVRLSRDREMAYLKSDVRSASIPTTDVVTADTVTSPTTYFQSEYRRRKLKILQLRYKAACTIPKSPRCRKLTLVLGHARGELDSASITGILESRDPGGMLRSRRHVSLHTIKPLGWCLTYDSSVGIERFDPSVYICCDGLFNRTSPTQKCCARAVIEGTEQGCCDDRIYNLTQFQDGQVKHFSCCGKKVIESDGRTCIAGVVMGVYADEPSNTTSDMTLVHEVWPDAGNNTKFDTNNTNYHTNHTNHNYHTNHTVGDSGGGGDIGSTTERDWAQNLVIGLSVGGGVVVLLVVGGVWCHTRKKLKGTFADHPLNMEDNSLPYSVPPLTPRCSGTPVSHKSYCINMEMSTVNDNAEQDINQNTTDAEETFSVLDNSTEPFENGNTSITRNQVHSDEDSVFTNEEERFDMMWEQYKRNDARNMHKEQTDIPGNLLSDHFITTSTQTGEQKQTNKRDIFGHSFECTAYLDMHGRTMQMPTSDVKMSLPASCLGPHPVAVHGSTFSSITSLTAKLISSENEDLASPVVEYCVTGLGSLSEHACVELPFIGNPKEVKVYKFASTEGTKSCVESIPVPKRGKNNDDLDLYCVIKGNKAFVYTRSFSGFYCTTNRHRRMLSLRTFLFGSFKRFNPDRYEVRIRMYVADELVKFADYKPRMLELEAGNGRRLFVDEDLELPDTDLNEKGELLARIAPGSDTWVHKLRPDNGLPVMDRDQSVPLHRIVAACPQCDSVHARQSDMPYCVQWYLTNKPHHRPEYTFQCLVDVEVRPEHSDGPRFQSKSRIIDELQLRPEDQLPVEEMNEGVRIDGIKRYIITELLPLEQEKLLEKLRSRQGIHHASTTEDVFVQLHEYNKPGGIIKLVVTSLRELNMHTKLDDLIKQDMVPTHLIPKPTRAVSENQQHGHVASLTRQPIHDDVTRVHNDQLNATAASNQLLLPKVNNTQASQTSRHRRDMNGQRESTRGACAIVSQHGSPHQETEGEISDQLTHLEIEQEDTGMHRDSSFSSIYNRNSSFKTGDSAYVQPSECRPELNSDVIVSGDDSTLCNNFVCGETTPMLSGQNPSTGQDETALKEPYQPLDSSDEDV